MQRCKFNQSAYINYLVDEAIKDQTDSLTTPSSAASDQYHSLPSTVPYCWPKTYPVDYNPSQNAVQDSEDSQPSSFGLNQHISTNELQNINTNQLNNKINVQFHFEDADCFCIQSKEPGEINSSLKPLETNTSCTPHNLDFSNPPLFAPLSNTPAVPYGQTSQNFSQFIVKNIIKKNIYVGTDQNSTQADTQIQDDEFDPQAEAKEYYNLYIQKEKNKQERQKYQHSVTKQQLTGDQGENHQLYPPPRPAVLEKYNNTGLIGSKTKVLDVHTGLPNLHTQQIVRKTGNRGIFIKDKDQGISHFDHLLAQKEYYKQYLEQVRKKKLEKEIVVCQQQDTVSVQSAKLWKANYLWGMMADRNSDEEMETKYECEICVDEFRSAEELKKHFKQSHNNNIPKNEDFKDCDSHKNNENDMNCSFDVERNTDTVGSCSSEGNSSSQGRESCMLSSNLCSMCGFKSQFTEVLKEHEACHLDKEEHEKVGDVHKEAREYYQMSMAMAEKQDERKLKKLRDDEMRTKLEKAKAKMMEGNLLKPDSESMQKRKASTQAKNNLMNPSKGKQKSVRNIENLSKQDRVLMNRLGILPSSVCLKRVHENENYSLDNETYNGSNNCRRKEHSDSSKELENTSRVCRRKSNYKGVHKRAICNVKSVRKAKKENTLSEDDNSDVEIIEQHVIVLDEDDDGGGGDVNERDGEKTVFEEGSKKRNRDVPKQNSDNKEESSFANDIKKQLTDEELMAKFGIKDLSVSVTSIHEPEKNISKPYPKSGMPLSKRSTVMRNNSGGTKLFAQERKSVDEMSQKEISDMLEQCGMGVSVPVQPLVPTQTLSEQKKNSSKFRRSGSPEPSTSKGHGCLKRKRTARKSLKDSDLFEKFKLKDSKVILKSLSRIDVSLLRNPNSPVGKSDWLQHKFDSDGESDIEWDIPTPPLVEDFVENTDSAKSEKKVNSKTDLDKHAVERSVKQKDQEMREKFGISDAVVIIDSPKKKLNINTEKRNSSEKNACSDAELLKKFGIKETQVVVASPKKNISGGYLNQSNKDSENSEIISFEYFRKSLDIATKNILSKLRGATETDGREEKKYQNPGTVKPGQIKQKCKDNDVKTDRGSEKQKLSSKGFTQKRKHELSDDGTRRKVRVREVKSELLKGTVQSASNVRNLRNTSVRTFRNTVSAEMLPKQTRSCKSLKMFKAKAVNRAIDARHKKRIQRNIKVEPTKKGKIGSKETHKVQGCFSRHNKVVNDHKKSLQRSVDQSKQLGNLSSNDKKNSVKSVSSYSDDKYQIIEQKPIVFKTARYRRSVGDKKPEKRKGSSTKLEKMVKCLPKLEVTLPYLTEEEIFILGKSVAGEDKKVKLKDMSPEILAKQLIDELINKVCSGNYNENTSPEELEGDCGELKKQDKETDRKNVLIGNGNVSAFCTENPSDLSMKYCEGEVYCASNIGELTSNDSLTDKDENMLFGINKFLNVASAAEMPAYDVDNESRNVTVSDINNINDTENQIDGTVSECSLKERMKCDILGRHVVECEENNAHEEIYVHVASMKTDDVSEENKSEKLINEESAHNENRMPPPVGELCNENDISDNFEPSNTKQQLIESSSNIVDSGSDTVVGEIETYEISSEACVRKEKDYVELTDIMDFKQKSFSEDKNEQVLNPETNLDDTIE